MFNKSMIVPNVRNIIVALCADYERRQRAIEEHTVSARTENEYKYYNYKIYEAAAEIVGPGEAEMFINDIGAKRGFWSSESNTAAESTYKYKKRSVIIGIANALHLI